MTITDQWTEKERLEVIEAIARKIEEVACVNDGRNRGEIADKAFIIRLVASRPQHEGEANRKWIMREAGEAASK